MPQKWMIYLLALGVFLTATSELIVTGVVRAVAEDLNVSLAMAGQMVTVYSLAFAIGTPIIVSLTARAGRKKLLIGALLGFVAGSLILFASRDIALALAARAVLGVSSGVYMVVAFGAASRLTPPERLGRAIGTIVLGFSLAMVLGVPLGILITDWWNWRAIFLLLALLGLPVAWTVAKLVPEAAGDAPASFGRQLKIIGSVVIVSGLLFTLMKETGNSALFTFLLPFMEDELGIHARYASFVMLALGLFGALGSRLGGYGVDRWGAGRVMTATTTVHLAVVTLLPLLPNAPAPGLALLAIMALSMFATGPAVQSYVVQHAPDSANLTLSLNTSIVHLGLAAGAGGGGLLLESAGTLRFHPWMAGMALALALAAAFVSFSAGRRPAAAPTASCRSC